MLLYLKYNNTTGLKYKTFRKKEEEEEEKKHLMYGITFGCYSLEPLGRTTCLFSQVTVIPVETNFIKDADPSITSI